MDSIFPKSKCNIKLFIPHDEFQTISTALCEYLRGRNSSIAGYIWYLYDDRVSKLSANGHHQSPVLQIDRVSVKVGKVCIPTRFTRWSQNLVGHEATVDADRRGSLLLYCRCPNCLQPLSLTLDAPRINQPPLNPESCTDSVSAQTLLVSKRPQELLTQLSENRRYDLLLRDMHLREKMRVAQLWIGSILVASAVGDTIPIEW